MKHLATAITKDDYWVLLSKPCTKEEAEKMAAEVTKIVDEEGNTLADLK